MRHVTVAQERCFVVVHLVEAHAIGRSRILQDVEAPASGLAADRPFGVESGRLEKRGQMAGTQVEFHPECKTVHSLSDRWCRRYAAALPRGQCGATTNMRTVSRQIPSEARSRPATSCACEEAAKCASIRARQ